MTGMSLALRTPFQTPIGDEAVAFIFARGLCRGYSARPRLLDSEHPAVA
jgi:hypothetical protein